MFARVVFATEVLSEQYKLGASYNLAKIKDIRLRVTNIPQEFTWITRDLDGKVEPLKEGSLVVFENVEAIEIAGQGGNKIALPEGSKFYAKLSSADDAKKFHRKGKVKLKFYEIQAPMAQGTKIIKMDEAQFDSSAASTVVSDSLKAVAKVGAYSLAGAVVAPLVTFAISGSGILGLGLLSNPYVLAGSSAIGGAAGLIYGLQKKGEEYRLEPGTEIKLSLNESWTLMNKDSMVNNAPIAEANEKFKLDVLNVKKSRDVFDDKCIKVSLSYENNTGENLHYTNFLLVDSMGKEFYPSLNRLDDYSSDGLPKKANLDLYFASDFINAIHKLEVRRSHDQKPLAAQRIVLK